MLWGGRHARVIVVLQQLIFKRRTFTKPHQIYDPDCSRTALEMGNTMVVVVKVSQSNLLLHGVLPRVERRPTKKTAGR